jgi:peptidoglycan/LPS O-acetylase OafA/YrhL
MKNTLKNLRFYGFLLGMLFLGTSCGDSGPGNAALLGLAAGGGGAVIGANMSGPGTNNKLAGGALGALIGGSLGMLAGSYIPAPGK